MLFTGKHYREEWTTPVEIPILDLERSAGGLRPHKRTGGMQSKSLIFKTADGSRYMFRSINKDPSALVPEKLRETFVTDIVYDQFSTAHPYGAVVVPVLADAAGVLHTNPIIIVLPDHETLGKFREDFAGELGIMEEFVMNRPDNTPGFAGLSRIIGTSDLFTQLEDSFDNLVDQKAYLRARLLDIFIGDWDRHTDQWRWGHFDENGKNIWRPIPLDRDQAFVKFDGLLSSVAEDRIVVPQMEGFDKKKPDVWSLTYSGRHTDRLFLNALTREDFSRITAAFVQNMSDEVIEEGIRRMPKEIQELSGVQLTKKLQHRRTLMVDIAEQYYENLAEWVEIVGHNRAEVLMVNRLGNDHVELSLYRRNEQNGEKEGKLFYYRVFKREETEEIRVFLKGGNDKAIVTGNPSKSILVRIVGGPGDDELIDKSNGKTVFYDTKENTGVVVGPQTIINTADTDSVINAHEYEPEVPTYGSLTLPLPIAWFSPDDGFVLGLGLLRTQYSFRNDPYKGRVFVHAEYAFGSQAFRTRFKSKFTESLFGLGLKLDTAINPIEVTNYYGLGNDTERDADLEKNNFYRVRANHYWVRPLLHTPFSSKIVLLFGMALRRFHTRKNISDARFVLIENPYGIDINDYFELTGEIDLDFRDYPILPSRGTYWNFGLSAFPKIFDNENIFVKGFAKAESYLTVLKNLTFALQMNGEKVWETFPYYEAAYLGGPLSLRGFQKRRFGGDAALFGRLEIRRKFLDNLIIIPDVLGLFLFGETGRVWFNGNSPGTWHWDAGFGFSYTPFVTDASLTLAFAFSEEALRVTLGGGFKF